MKLKRIHRDNCSVAWEIKLTEVSELAMRQDEKKIE